MSLLKYNKQIDGLRFFAVLGVLICHFIRFENIYLARLPFGQGVNLFFVLSGYLITKILILNKDKLAQGNSNVKRYFVSFFARRSIRIFPIYYITILFLMLISFQNIWDVWGWLVTYTTNFYASFGYPYIGSFNHLWSLAVEEQFYLVWPVLIYLVPKKHLLKLIISTILLSVSFKILYFYFIGNGAAINSSTIGCADSLGLGALIAYLHLFKPELLVKLNQFKSLILLSFGVFAFFLIFPRPSEAIAIIGNNFLFSVFAFFVVLKASTEKFTFLPKFLFEHKFTVHLGKISYGIYLYHFFMPDFFNQCKEWLPALNETSANFQVGFLFISSLVFAQVSWIVIEKPVLGLKDKFSY